MALARLTPLACILEKQLARAFGGLGKSPRNGDAMESMAPALMIGIEIGRNTARWQVLQLLFDGCRNSVD